MKIAKSLLKNAIGVVMHSVATVGVNPALNGVLFSCHDGVLNLYSTDLVTATKHSIEIDQEDEFDFIIDAKLINNIVKSLPNEECEIEYDGSNVHVKSGRAKFKLNTIQGSEFPDFVPASENGFKVVLEAQKIKDMISKVVFCAANDAYMLNLRGVYWEFNESYLRLVAADGFRLGYIDTEIDNSNEFSFLLNLKTMRELPKILSAYSDTYFTLVFDTSKVSFILGNTQVVSRPVDAEFPDYKKLFKREYKTKITVPSKELLKIIKQVAVLSSDAIKIRINSGILTAEAKLPDYGEAAAELPISQEGSEQYFAINPTLLSDVLANFETDVEITLINETSAIHLQPATQVLMQPVYLIMPIRM